MMKILIVEDTQDVEHLLKPQIDPSEYELTACATVTASLQAFKKDFFTLVLVHAHVGESDGLELCRQFRKTPKGKHCLIVLLSDVDDPQELQQALDAGIDDYLVLPLGEEMLKLRWRVIERDLQRLSERNKALKALKPSLEFIERAKQEWEVTADVLTSIVCLLDCQGSIVRANRTIERWQLGDVMTVKGQKVHQLLHSECTDDECRLQGFLQESWQAVSQGKPVETELEDPVLQRELHIQFQPILDIQGKNIKKTDSFAVLIVRDITLRIQTEKKLQQTSSELRAVFQSLPDEYFRLSANGNVLDYKTEHDTISSFSKTFLLKWASGMLPKEIEQEFDLAVAQVLKTRMPATVNCWMPVPGGERRYEEIRVLSFLKDQVLVVVRDMTDWQLKVKQ
ncbi:MAG: response regulator transcription factor [bacterium]|nr:response regulator transcription factor [bacterium]